jgi:hypothetical protein
MQQALESQGNNRYMPAPERVFIEWSTTATVWNELLCQSWACWRLSAHSVDAGVKQLNNQ